MQCAFAITKLVYTQNSCNNHVFSGGCLHNSVNFDTVAASSSTAISVNNCTLQFSVCFSSNGLAWQLRS